MRSILPSIVFAVLLALRLNAADPATMPLIDFAKDGSEKRVEASSPEVTFTRKTDGAAPELEITCALVNGSKDGYPGVSVKPDGGAWDLSAYGRIDVRIANTGVRPLTLNVRVDNDGDWKESPWSTESVSVDPNSVATASVFFGYSYGKRAFKLDPAKITKLLLFTGKTEATHSYRIEAIVAAGAPGEKPQSDSQLTKPKDGLLLGAGTTVDAKQIDARKAKADLVADGGRQSLRIAFPKAADETGALLKSGATRWDLRPYTQVVIKARGTGTSPVALRARLECVGGHTEWVASPSADARQEIVIPFIGTTPWTGEANSGSQFVNDSVTGVTIQSTAGDDGRLLIIDEIRATAPLPDIPAWLGKKPPVDGKWTQTLDENFDGSTIDAKHWTVTGDNYWDKQSHFSKDNVIVGGGVAKLRFEKKRGHANDDPAKPETDYTVGFLTSFDKWTQRYGYFEARMKLPTAPGLWPAFWMMPDRGAEAGIWWKRSSTGEGGMEFDIMEHLTRYGKNRYNIAFHWDGYEKDHKSIGTDRIYVAPDKDGYIVSGLLWEPGRLTLFGNGVRIATWSNERISNVPEHLMFTLPCGGWGGNELDDTGLPDDFVIDWVRAWQRDDFAALPPKPPAKADDH